MKMMFLNFVFKLERSSEEHHSVMDKRLAVCLLLGLVAAATGETLSLLPYFQSHLVLFINTHSLESVNYPFLFFAQRFG